MKTTSIRTAFAAAVMMATVLALAAADNTCLDCHKTLQGPASVPAHDWPTSIHFANGIACADCHGGDPKAKDPGEAMNPAKGFRGKPSKTEVPAFCGRCHDNIVNNYVTSAHYLALKGGVEKAPNCVTCHTAHQQQKVTLDLINPKTCGQCHTYDRAARLREAMSGMEDRLTGLEKRKTAVFLEGLDVDQDEKTLMSVRNRVHGLTHVLDIPRIMGEMGAVHPDLSRLERRVAEKEKTVADRKALGTGIMGLFLAGAVIAWMTYKRIDHHAI